MDKKLKKVCLAAIFAVCPWFFGCRAAPVNYPVEFVDRNAVFLPGTPPNPLTLVVDIAEDGKLSLNKIETGTIDDAAELSERLKTVFEDRERSGIGEREVVIDPQGNVGGEKLEKLIESLAGAKAAPIRIVICNKMRSGL